LTLVGSKLLGEASVATIAGCREEYSPLGAVRCATKHCAFHVASAAATGYSPDLRLIWIE